MSKSPIFGTDYMDYKTAGVNIEAGNAFVERLKKKVPAIGGFNGMMRVPSGYEEPVLVSGTDGVGTKINICSYLRDYTTIGIDLVAMCVNDVITSGAKPLYFLDYISLNSINPVVDDIMTGVIKGCEISGMELLGGETAEHPMTFDIDLAGFCNGIVEKNEVIDGSLIRKGDKIVGLPSSGLHSNGYSLVNQLIRQNKLPVTKDLLTPTTIYAKQVEELLDEIPIVGMAHITGGGLEENVSRIIPEGLNVRIDYNSWNLPEIFTRVMLAGEIPPEEMKKIFNLGIGYVLIVPPEVDYGIQIGEVW